MTVWNANINESRVYEQKSLASRWSTIAVQLDGTRPAQMNSDYEVGNLLA